jgi:hypothetical protein
MKKTLSIAVAVLTLAAAPALAQSQGGDANGGGKSERSEGAGGGDGGGRGEPGAGSRLNAVAVGCFAQPCTPPREKRPRLKPQTVNAEKDLCGQQLTFGRDAIFYFGHCDRRF